MVLSEIFLRRNQKSWNFVRGALTRLSGPVQNLSVKLWQKLPHFKALGSKYPEPFNHLCSTDVVIASVHINTVQNHSRAKCSNWGYHAHPCWLFKQAKEPHPPPKPLLAPKSGSFAKSSPTLNIHSTGEEKANSGKVQDWRQTEPHVRNSFLITGNALAHCIKKCSGSYSSCQRWVFVL